LTNDLTSSGIKYSIGIQSSYTVAVALGVVNKIILTKYLSYECLHLTLCDTSGGLLISSSSGATRIKRRTARDDMVDAVEVPMAASAMGSGNSGSMAMGNASSGSMA
jgi:hypothetical protein